MSEYDELFDDDLDSNINFDLGEDGDEQFDGLDKHAAKTWIYPTNLPLRQYQFDIVQTALFHNTMVSLPTGLGKTMIAAVVMYNMYRWYPLGRIIFMAPTRPLVAQQADACRKITCIPKEHTIQLTGDVQNTTRGPIWENTRVFFITPQILQKDLQAKICPVQRIRCIVIDEAHRARGNYAYCEVLRLLGDHASKVRILALSATPGATSTQVAEVCRALKIARLEIRTEASVDVKPYVFTKITETVVVHLGEPLATIRDKYIQILDYYTRRLMKCGVLTGSAGNIHKGRIFMVQKEYKENCQRMGKRPENHILQDLTFCLTLYHAFEVLIKHGLRGFVAFYDEHGGDKGWVRKDDRLTNLLMEIKQYLGPTELNLCPLPDGTIPDIEPNMKFGHPKFYKLRDICQQHFNKYPDTRVMIFCEYRDSVQEAFAALLTCRPLIRPRMFLGQSAISQKQQLSVMEKFRKGDCNTLICTCVAEEGLDVAAVQLIICFDIANRSPIRLAQRMGRTGRHQIGRVVILVTEGREQQTLAETMQQSSLLDEKLAQSMIVKTSLLPEGPLMLPPHIQPTCLQLHMEATDKAEKKQKSPKGRARKSLEEHELQSWNQKLPDDKYIPTMGECLWTLSKDDLDNFQIRKSNKFQTMFAPSNFLKQISVKPLFGPSVKTELLTALFRKSEELKFNLPVKNIKSSVAPKTKNRDIREMFGKSVQSQQDKNDFATQNNAKIEQTSQRSTKSIASIKTNSMLVSLVSELANYRTVQLLLEKNCHVCDTLLNCETLTDLIQIDTECSTKLISVPDDSVLNSLTHENLTNYEIVQNNDYFDFEKYNREREFEKLRQIHDPNYSLPDFYAAPMNPLTLGDPIKDDNVECMLETDNSMFVGKGSAMESSSIIEDASMQNITGLQIDKTNEKAIYELEDSFHFNESALDISKMKSICKLDDSLNSTKYFNESVQNVSEKMKAIYELEDSFNCTKNFNESALNSSENDKTKTKHEESFNYTKNFNESVLNISKNDQTKRKLEESFNNTKNFNESALNISENDKTKTKREESFNYTKNFNESALNISKNDQTKRKLEESFNNTKNFNESALNISENDKTKTKREESFNYTKNFNESALNISKKDQTKRKCEESFNYTKNFTESALNISENDQTKRKFEDSFNYTENFNESAQSVVKSNNTMDTSICNVTCEEYDSKRIARVSNISLYVPDDISKKALQYFGLQKVEDIFEDDRLDNLAPKTNVLNANVTTKMEDHLDNTRQDPVSPVLFTQKRFSSPFFANQTSVETKKDFVLWDESLFVEDSEAETSNHVISPVLHSQRFKQQKQTKNNGPVGEKLTSPILCTKRTQNVISSQNRVQTSSELNLDYLSDEDIFAEDSSGDDSHAHKFDDTSQKENIINNAPPASDVVKSNKLNMFQLKRNANLTEVNSNTPKTSFVPIIDSDSDDASLLDFMRPTKKKLKLTLNKSSPNTSHTLSDESFGNEEAKPENTSIDLAQFSFAKKKVLGQVEKGGQTSVEYRRPSLKLNKPPTKTKIRSEFIEYEAEVSDEEGEMSDENDVDGSFDDSFVVDNHEFTQTNVDMHAHYLQSVKNNSQNGKFKIPNLPPVKMADICSQPDWNQTESNYVLDSFCVDNTIVMNEELSLLEIAEMKLARENRRKRKKRDTTKKLSRIRRISDDSSSEDEDLKKLRMECLNNQSVLR